jgi:hypothetical protein
VAGGGQWWCSCYSLDYWEYLKVNANELIYGEYESFFISGFLMDFFVGFTELNE